MISCFFTNRANSPPEKRVLTVAAWVVSISLAILGLVHFSASFDQGLLTVTKMVLTVTIHMVVFGAQLSIVWYYVWAEHVELTLYQKMKRTLIPTTAMALAYGIAEAIVVGLFWSTTVLKRGIGALTIFWLCIRILWTLIYTTAITVGLIHPRSWKLPSTIIHSSSNFSLPHAQTNHSHFPHCHRSFCLGYTLLYHALYPDGGHRRSFGRPHLQRDFKLRMHCRNLILGGIPCLCASHLRVCYLDVQSQ